MGNYVLEVRGINKSFPGTKALDSVDFCIRPGEVVGLVGENGAGKSTLMKIITGVYSVDSGEILLDGKAVNFGNSLEALEAGVAIMHQELNLFKNLSVYENIYLNRSDYIGTFGRIDRNKMRVDAKQLMCSLGADIDPDVPAFQLSIRKQQLVEIARAVSSHAKVVIMDEPSAALTEGEVQKLFEVIRKLTISGVAVVYVSHRMNEIKQICDRVCVLRDGKNAGDLSMEENDTHHIVTLMVGREVENYYPRHRSKAGDVLLEVDGLNCGFVGDISFQAKANEIVCLYGLAGSGTTELAECIFGLRRASGGKVVIAGNGAALSSPAKAIRCGVAYVPPDRRGEGIIADMSVESNLILATLQEDSTASFLHRKRIRKHTQQYKEMFRIKMVDPQQKIMLLSGGNQQKVILAKWLKTKPSVLILNEPTRGVDVGAKAEIYAIIDDLAQSGIAVILISSEVSEVIGMADRVLVMNKGRLAAELPVDGCNQEILLKAASGGL